MFDNSERKLERTKNGSNTISSRAFNLIMGLTVLWGIILNIIICAVSGDSVINYIKQNENGLVILAVVMIAYLVIAITASVIAYNNSNPIVSFSCFTVISIITGLILAIYIPYFSSNDILDAFIITAIITLAMITAGCVIPSIFLKMGRMLFFSLLIMIFVDIIYALVVLMIGSPFNIIGIAIDFIIALIFTLYIAYDFSKSQLYIKNVDNAIDSALDIYMDIINLFIRILNIISESK